MDNPRKKKADGKRVSQQPHEQAYQRSKAKKKNSSSDKPRSGTSGSQRTGGR